MKTQRMKKNLGKEAIIMKISLISPVIWLKKGIQDFIQCPGLAIFYGLCLLLLLIHLIY